MSKKKTPKVMGTQQYINVETGEVINLGLVSMDDDKEGDSNFYKLFMKEFIYAIDLISNQRTKVAYWIIENVNRNNQLLYSYRQIAEKTGISYTTVAQTIKILKDADFLKEDGKILIVNPDIIFKGTKQRRTAVARMYANAPAGDVKANKELRLSDINDTLKKLEKQRERLEQEIQLLNADETTDNAQLSLFDNDESEAV